MFFIAASRLSLVWQAGPPFTVVCRLVTVVLSLVAEHRAYVGFSDCSLRALEHRLNSCGTRV